MKIRMNSIKHTAACAAVCLFYSLMLHAQSAVTVFNTSNSDLPNNAVRALTRDGQGKLWVGTDWGLASYDGSNWEVYRQANSDLPSNSIRSLAVEDDTILWVGTFEMGLVKFDGVNWTNWNSGNSSLPEDHVRAIAPGLGGELWVGTGGGLVRIKGNDWKIYDFIGDGYESNNVGCLLAVAPDTVWAGMVNGGLIHVMDTTVDVQTIANSGLNDNTIAGIDIDNGDDLWCATPAGGLAYFQNLTWFNYNPFNSNNPAFTLNEVIVDQYQNIWIATLDKGIVYYDRQNWSYYDSTNSDVPELNVRTLWLDEASHTLWGGTNNEGLFAMDIQLVGRGAPVQPGLGMYPLPAKTEVFLELEGRWEGAEVKLYDLSGRQVEASRWNKGRAVPLNLEEGVYLLEVVKNGQRRTGKVHVCPGC